MNQAVEYLNFTKGLGPAKRKDVYRRGMSNRSKSNALAANFVLEVFKIIRGYGGAAIAATQDINDFFALNDGKYGKGIISNSKTKIILQLESSEAEHVQEIFELSDRETMNITRFERGNVSLLPIQITFRYVLQLLY